MGKRRLPKNGPWAIPEGIRAGEKRDSVHSKTKKKGAKTKWHLEGRREETRTILATWGGVCANPTWEEKRGWNRKAPIRKRRFFHSRRKKGKRLERRGGGKKGRVRHHGGPPSKRVQRLEKDEEGWERTLQLHSEGKLRFATKNRKKGVPRSERGGGGRGHVSHTRDQLLRGKEGGSLRFKT